MKISGAIFDLDGTMLDSMGMWETCNQDFLIKQGVTPIETLTADVVSKTFDETIAYIKEMHDIPLSIPEISQGIGEYVENFYINEAKIKDGVADFLAYLKSKGVKMCIATNSERVPVEGALKRLGIYDFFEKIFICPEVGSNKETPLIYRKAAEFLNVPKEEIWVFEDAIYAVKTAKKDGFNVCGIYDKWEPETEEIKEVADIYIKSFDEARDYFD